MADIAKDGKGRGYVALDPETIPQIFTTETLLISRDLIIEKPVTPTLVAGVGPLKGLAPSNIPALGGYVLTYPKPKSELLMRVDKDPLLVAWRYGLGRVMAFTSDLSGRWGKDWIAWRNFPQWASQLARDTMRKIIETQTRTDFLADGDSVKVVADVIGRDGKFMNFLQLKANITTSNQPGQEALLQQTAPGRYEGRFIPAAQGVHFHDGSTLTSADIKASYDKIIFPPAGVKSLRKESYSSVEVVEAPDPYTVRFRLKYPESSLLLNLASPWNWIYKADILSKDMHWYETHVMGTGPFTFVTHVKGSEWVGKRNPNYWDKGKPYLDGYRALFVTSSAQQVAAGGCIATCAYGTECNPRTGFCEPSRCGKCPSGERCVASADGFRCTSGGVVPPPATLRTQPPVGAGLVPGVGFTAQPGLPPPSPQERSDAHVK